VGLGLLSNRSGGFGPITSLSGFTIPYPSGFGCLFWFQIDAAIILVSLCLQASLSGSVLLEKKIILGNSSFNSLLRGKSYVAISMVVIQPLRSLRSWLSGVVKDARVMSWILRSIDPLIMLNLRPYKIVKTMWEYLLKVYHQDNTTRRFQLEYEITSYTQGNLSIEKDFFGFQNLWGEFSDMVYAKVPAASLSTVQAIHEQSKRDQFLMKLYPKFEVTHSNLMNRDPSPSLDVCFRELLHKKQLLLIQAMF
jgi:hypothetical protein